MFKSNRIGVETLRRGSHHQRTSLFKSNRIGVETAFPRDTVIGVGSNRTVSGLKRGFHEPDSAVSRPFKSNRIGVET